MKLLTYIFLSFTLYRASLAIPLIDRDATSVIKRNSNVDHRIGGNVYDPEGTDQRWSDDYDASDARRRLASSGVLLDKRGPPGRTKKQPKSPTTSPTAKEGPGKESSGTTTNPSTGNGSSGPANNPPTGKGDSDPTTKPPTGNGGSGPATVNKRPKTTKKKQEPGQEQCLNEPPVPKGGGRTRTKAKTSTQKEQRRSWPGIFEKLFRRAGEIPAKGDTIEIRDPQSKINGKKYVLEELTGTGASAINFESGEFYLKRSKIAGKTGNGDFQKEVDRTQKADQALYGTHGIFVGSGKDQYGNLWMVTRAGGVTLGDRWQGSRRPVDQCRAEAQIVKQWLNEAQKKLHALGFIHLDVSGENVLVPPKETTLTAQNIRLIDYGKVKEGVSSGGRDEAIEEANGDFEPPLWECEGWTPSPCGSGSGGSRKGSPMQQSSDGLTDADAEGETDPDADAEGETDPGSGSRGSPMSLGSDVDAEGETDYGSP